MERYEQIRVIGQGAFGKVYLVNRKSDGKHVVTKEIPVDDLPKAERQSALNEVKVLKLLKHPNIVAYYDNFVEDKKLVIVMEYAPGGTLHDFIQDRNGTLMDEDHVLQFFVQMLVAIDHVHSVNILHRDLKTQNVMMNRTRSVLKIGDFGISKVLSSKITSARTVVGTPCYISPEICEGKMYAKKSDIWALGCILYEMTTLNKAFEGPNLPALVMKIMRASAGLTPIGTSYSHGLDKLIHSLLQKNPDDRPSIHSVMATPVVVNALMNLCTDVGRLPCSKHTQSSVEVVREQSGDGPAPPQTYRRMGSLGKYRQRSFFQDDSVPQGQDVSVKAPPKPLVYLLGGGSTVPMRLNVPNTLTDTGIVGVACGRSQRAGVTEDGKLIFWELVSGSLMTTRFTMTQSRGSRGGGRGPLVFEPRLVGGLKTTVIKKVACGDMFTACLTDKGILMTFGSGINGCLGHGDSKDVTEPRLVHEMLAHETVEIACGANHMLAITSEGSLYSWGKGDKGQLGLGVDKDQHSPRKVQLPVESPPLRASCGVDCSIIVTERGQLLACGNNRFNKLSLDQTDFSSDKDSPSLTSPTSTSHTSTSALTEQPRLPSHVTSHKSQHAVGQGARVGGVPVIISLMKNRSGNTKGGSVYLGAQKMESSSEGVGIPATAPVQSQSTPGSIKGSSTFTLSGSQLVNSVQIVSVSVGTNHTAMITAGKECLTCGDNSYGQLGYQRDDQLVAEGVTGPAPVQSLTRKDMELVSCGDFYTIVSCKGGTVYSWGYGRRGRLGRDATEDVFEPQVVPFEQSSHSVGSVDSSHSVTLLLSRPDT